MKRRALSVAIGGLGAIGLPLARALDQGIEGLRLIAVADRDDGRAREKVAGLRHRPRITDLDGLAQADIVVEAAPAAVFEQIAVPAIEAGRILVPASVGALLPRMHLVERAQETGARIVVPTGALLGLDAVRAAAEGEVRQHRPSKPASRPRGLAGAPYLAQHGIDVLAGSPRRSWCSRATRSTPPPASRPTSTSPPPWRSPASARSAPRSRSGPTRRSTATSTPSASRRRRRGFTMTIENVPSDDNPRTGRLTPLSVLACLRGLVSTLKVGS